MRRTLIIVAAILLVLMPTTARAITDGTPDTANKYPFVGLLAFRDAQNN